MKSLRLSEIWIYPIKSLGGIRLRSAKVFEKGLEFDRRWMLVDENGVFLTQRNHPTMALFKVSLENDRIHIQKRNPTVFPDTISFPTKVTTGVMTRVKIWNDDVYAEEVAAPVSEWFSRHLGFGCRLVSFPEVNSRPVDPNYKVNDENVSLADAYPFLIIGQSSLDDLNKRLPEPVPMRRFRPNFVFTGGDPYEEDTWRNFSIGKNDFVGVKNCARCVLTTVNPDTGVKGTEPLLTLSTYRKKDNKVLFGQNLVALDHVEVNEGDEIKLK